MPVFCRLPETASRHLLSREGWIVNEGGLDRLSNWKASEYRLVMLYIGPVLLKYKKIVSKEVHDNFLQLSAEMHFLLAKQMQNFMHFVINLVFRFVEGLNHVY